MHEIIAELQQRGLIQQCSDLAALDQLLQKGPLPFYLGIDPTAPSLHCGHLLPILLAKRLALAGHQPLLLLGSGTAKIGDPSGKTEMRQMLSKQEITANAKTIRGQLQQIFADCENKKPIQHGKPIWLDNSDWLDNLNYIDFLRETGRHFSVNRMLSFESCKQRLERGLSLIEFNYQLLQSYDYLQLYKQHNCRLQIGGDDQWGNMVSGLDLIRRDNFLQAAGKQESVAYLPQALTVPLVLSANGNKMGKTEQGAIFLDPKLTSPFDFFQYWRNCSDLDVKKFLLFFTFLGLDEIHELCRAGGASLNRAKETLAYQMCRSIHGPDRAQSVLDAAKASFAEGPGTASLPGAELSEERLQKLDNEGISVIDLYIEAGLCSSRNEARRLIAGGGASINGQKINTSEQMIQAKDLVDGQLLLKAGKKRLFCFRKEEEVSSSIDLRKLRDKMDEEKEKLSRSDVNREKDLLKTN